MPNRTKHRRWLIAAVVVGILIAIAGTQLTVFVVPPIGAVPEGVTVVVPRMGGMSFLDSADNWCRRNQGRATPLCRAAILVNVAENVIVRLPYSATLYDWSAGE